MMQPRRPLGSVSLSLLHIAGSKGENEARGGGGAQPNRVIVFTGGEMLQIGQRVVLCGSPSGKHLGDTGGRAEGTRFSFSNHVAKAGLGWDPLLCFPCGPS